MENNVSFDEWRPITLRINGREKDYYLTEGKKEIFQSKSNGDLLGTGKKFHDEAVYDEIFENDETEFDIRENILVNIN